MFFTSTLNFLWDDKWYDIIFYISAQGFVSLVGIIVLVFPQGFGLKRRLGFNIRPEEDAQISFYDYNWQSALIVVSFIVVVTWEILIYFKVKIILILNFLFLIFFFFFYFILFFYLFFFLYIFFFRPKHWVIFQWH